MDADRDPDRGASGRLLLALQASREPEINAAAFIDYMFDVITEALESYEARAKAGAANVGASVGRNVGVSDAVLALLRLDPTLTVAAIAARLGTTSRTIERHLADLKAAGLVRREGSPKAGRWVVTDR